MKNILFICLTLFVFACKSTKKVNEVDQTSTDTNQATELVRISSSIGQLDQISDPITISDVRLVGNKLFVDVTYGGGCKDHEFQLIGAPSLSKSLPPIRSIQLMHQANGDACKMLLTQTLEIDLKNLAYQQEKGSVIFLNLNGWKNTIEYTYE